VTLKCGFQATQGHSNWYHSKALVRYVSYLPSIVTMHHFGDKARYWSIKYSMRFGMEKSTMAWLPDGVKILKIRLFVFTSFTNVTDGHTHPTHRRNFV